MLILRALLLSVFLFTFGCSKEEVAQTAIVPEIAVLKLQKQDISIPAEFVGQTKGAVDAEVRARVEGVLVGIHFKEGKEVKEGDLLYTIDSAPFEAKLAEAKAKLTEAETRLVKANSDLERIRPLAAIKAVSQRDLDGAVAQQGVAKGSVDAAKAVYDSASISLGYTKISAPVSGLIGLTKAKVGELVGKPNSSILTTISQLDPINVRFSITEREYLYFARLKKKQTENEGNATPTELTLVLSDDSIHTHKGTLASVDSQVDPTTGTLTIEASFPNPDKLIRPGQFAKIRAVGETLHDIIAVPKQAMRDIQGIKQVVVVNADNIAEVKNIKTGKEVGDLVEVLEGLSAGDLIVPQMQLRLKSGMKVQAKIQ
jgi:membrane fusion protein (multidrug efflux system)